MLFNEQSFLFLFLPIVFVGILLLRAGSPHLSSWWIILASFFFYGFHGWEHLPLLTFSILLNFGLGSAIHRKVGNRSAAHLLTFGIVCNLGVLAVFKYADFLTGSLGFEHSLNLSLPLAISFFTFQQIAYLVDVRKGKMTSPSFTHYAVFVSFFPQLIAGPIVRCQQIIPQLREGRLGKLSSQAFWIGLCLFSIGLFKKACMADGIRPLVEPIFESSSTGGTLSMVEAWLGATAFGLQIYFDFSAYSDMALGLGLLLGIRLPFNFDSPYKAVNVVDFWRRWHVTLSEFLRDYLYKPLGGNRLGIKRSFLNATLVMLLGGLWHGASWTFVFWGLLHGLFIGFNHLTRAFAQERGKTDGQPFWRLSVNRLLTFAFVTFAWVFFRSEDFQGAFSMLHSMIGLNGIDLPRSLGYSGSNDLFRFNGLIPNQVTNFSILPLFLLSIIIVWFMPNSLKIVGLAKDANSPLRVPSNMIILLCSVLLFWGIKVSFEQTTHEFLYFRF